MKHSFLTLLLLGTILTSGFSVMAQPETPAAAPKTGQERVLNKEEMFKKMEEHRQKMSEKMADDLKLTEEQRAQAKEIHERGRKDVEPMMNEMKNMRERIDERRRMNMEEFEKILTPEQKEKFETMKNNMSDMKGPRRHEGMRGMPFRHGPQAGMRHMPKHDGSAEPKVAK